MTPLSEEILARFQDGFDRATAAQIPEANAMTLATVDPEGRPAARTVLLKGHDADGFVFYTNLESRKGQHLAHTPQASAVFWWRENEEQVLIDGAVEPVSPQEADEYFASRPRGSQIGAWASQQSRQLNQRQALLDAVAEAEARFEGQDVPRPEHWSGFRIKPRRVEFWYGQTHRLHERVCFSDVDGQWVSTLLFP
ncbi:MAG: pyridoxamine 5'-phosphate oxidase [Wenzhouxiangella sp.]|nr:pyridoxamine 5'-phosphate oxidase [Wenzhouxiangella sp.]MDR9453103.1 pyridoxamine 5'-phosphate oxidase [Wenzhouxiangella sp.]